MKALSAVVLGITLGAGCANASDGPFGSCQSGECGSLSQAFECQVDVPPQAAIPSLEVVSNDLPPQIGGIIRDGQYIIKQVRSAGAASSIPGETFDFRDGYYHRNHTTYLALSGEPMTGFEETGDYQTEGPSLSLNGAACLGPETPRRTVVWQYSVRGSQLEFLKTSGDSSWLEIYERM